MLCASRNTRPHQERDDSEPPVREHRHRRYRFGIVPSLMTRFSGNVGFGGEAGTAVAGLFAMFNSLPRSLRLSIREKVEIERLHRGAESIRYTFKERSERHVR